MDSYKDTMKEKTVSVQKIEEYSNSSSRSSLLEGLEIIAKYQQSDAKTLNNALQSVSYWVSTEQQDVFDEDIAQALLAVFTKPEFQQNKIFVLQCITSTCASSQKLSDFFAKSDFFKIIKDLMASPYDSQMPLAFICYCCLSKHCYLSNGYSVEELIALGEKTGNYDVHCNVIHIIRNIFLKSDQTCKSKLNCFLFYLLKVFRVSYGPLSTLIIDSIVMFTDKISPDNPTINLLFAEFDKALEYPKDDTIISSILSGIPYFSHFGHVFPIYRLISLCKKPLYSNRASLALFCIARDNEAVRETLIEGSSLTAILQFIQDTNSQTKTNLWILILSLIASNPSLIDRIDRRHDDDIHTCLQNLLDSEDPQLIDVLIGSLSALSNYCELRGNMTLYDSLCPSTANIDDIKKQYSLP